MLAGLLITILVISLLAYVLWGLRDKPERGAQAGQSDDLAVGQVSVVRSGQSDLDDESCQAAVSTPLQRDAIRHQVAIVFLRAKLLRRLGWGVVCLAMIGVIVGVAAIPSMSAWWLCALPALFVGAMVASRGSYVAVNKALDARLAEIEQGDDELTRTITVAQAQTPVKENAKAGGREMSVDLAKPLHDSAPLSEPLPVVAPTYVNQPVLSRQVRHISIKAPGAGTDFPVTVDDSQDVLPFDLVVGS